MIQAAFTSLSKRTNGVLEKSLSMNPFTLTRKSRSQFVISPAFYRTQTVSESDGSGLHPRLILQDVVSGYKKQSIIDIKIGSRTWYPQASEDYISKCLCKDKRTTSLCMGFRMGIGSLTGRKFISLQ
ncbi:Inositol polyphosphate multikinase beta [Bienertia sinuspersici]